MIQYFWCFMGYIFNKNIEVKFVKNAITIRFQDGKIAKANELTELDNSYFFNNWIFEGKKEKIICTYKDEIARLKYQIFSNGFFKMSERNSSGKWITIKKGLLRKGSSKKFSGCIIIPTELVSNNIKCLLIQRLPSKKRGTIY